MEMHQLRYFVAVAQDLNATRAAARIHVTQQAISKAVAALERELGVTLLHRRPRGVSLTADGMVFLRDARAVLERAERARLVGRADGRPPRPEVRVGVVSGGESQWERLARAFRAAHPDHDLVAWRTLSHEDLLVPLLAGEVDAVVGAGRFDGDAAVRTDVLDRETRYALVPEASDYAAAPELRPADLLDARFGPRHPLEPERWEADWCLTPERGGAPRRARFDLPDACDDAIRLVIDTGCVVTQAASLLAPLGRPGSGMVAVPMPEARPVEITLTSARDLPALDLLHAVAGLSR